MPLGRRDWVEAGLRLLAERGIEAVKVDVLAVRLGISRGSFYWHFKDRGELLEAMLDRWEGTTGWLIEASSDAPTPEDKLRRLFGLIAEAESRHEHWAEPAVVAWSRHDARVAERVRAVELRRVGFVRGLFLEAGFGEEEASERANLAYLTFSGFVERAGRGVQPAAFGLEHLGELLVRMLFVPSLSEDLS